MKDVGKKRLVKALQEASSGKGLAKYNEDVLENAKVVSAEVMERVIKGTFEGDGITEMIAAAMTYAVQNATVSHEVVDAILESACDFEDLCSAQHMPNRKAMNRTEYVVKHYKSYL